MGRSHSFTCIMLEHITWKDESMLITFAKSKTQIKLVKVYQTISIHVYANPLNPKICPILALAVLMFTTHRSNEIGNH